MNDDELARRLESGRSPDSPVEAPGERAAERLRALLADDAVWAEPAADGADALVAAITAEAAGRERDTGGPPAGATGPHVVPLSRPRHLAGTPSARGEGRPSRRATRWSRRLAVLSAAAVVVLVAGVAAVVMAGGGDGGGREVAIGGTELAPEASAVATVDELGSGVAIELDVRGLPPAPPGTYYQAWVKGPDGLVTVGTFHMREGDDTVELWAGVDLDRYPTLTVTIQQEGGGQESSGQVVLSGEIGP